MAYTHYDRLSAIDTTFLEIEDPDVHMHVGAVALFEKDAVREADGSLDFGRLRAFVEASLPETPRFRQKIAEVPRVGSLVWVDDDRFNLDYHVRHTALPPPADIRQLKRLAGRIMSQKLDRGKPLWELWLVESVGEDHFAMIVKAHHAMVDGISGLELFSALLRLDADASIPEAPRWIPRPAPGPIRLVTDELARRAGAPLAAADGARRLVTSPVEALRSLQEGIRSVGETIGAGLAPTSDTVLNPELGPYRRFDWTSIDIEGVREIRKHLGGTLNDVVLTLVSGAVGRFLNRRGQDVTSETVFRVMVPVSIRRDDERGQPGNRVVNYLERLPIHETDPRTRLEQVVETSRKLKDSRLVRGAEIIEELGDRAFTGLLVQFVKLSATNRAYNLVVTNVPGPPMALHLLGAAMTEIYPLVPLFKEQGLGVALFSYRGRLYWGFNADWDALPDLHEFCLDVEREFEALLEAARAAGQPGE